MKSSWKTSFYGFGSIARKEIIHLSRDRTTLFIAMLIPVIQLTLFGFAINFDVRHIRTVVLDMDRSNDSRQYLQSLHNTQYLDIIGTASTPSELENDMRSGYARVGIIIPPDFSRKYDSGQVPEVRALIDGSDSTVALRAQIAFNKPPPIPPSGSVNVRFNILYNPDMRTETFMIPGLIGVIMQIVTISLTSFSLVREKENGTLEQLMVTPVGRLGMMIGKLLPYATLALIEMVGVIFLGKTIFDVQPAGNVLLLLLLSIPFIVSTLSLGLLISTIANNQAQAMQLTMLITLPTILLTGFVFPRQTMPGILYLLSYVFPATFFLEILRGMIVRGAGVMDLWQDWTGLIVIATVLLTLATSRFRKISG